MTGFGRAEGTVNDNTYIVEIRTLNGKQLDVNLKLPALVKPYEFDIRTMLQESLIRGYVECFISVRQNGSIKPVVINTGLIKSYFAQMKEVAAELDTDTNGVLAAILRLPEVVSPSNEVADDEEWNGLKQVIAEALKATNDHREDEGKALQEELETRVLNIQKLETEVARLEPLRRERIREELQKHIEENSGKESLDPNRLEQEIIYYIEKIDIREEQVRLRNHCKYFLEILKNEEISNGKKLAFLLQEMGREINTTGSKAYDADIQKYVVLMKDELEKAKEQTFNVL